MLYKIEVIVRVVGLDGTPVDFRGRPCDEAENQMQRRIVYSETNTVPGARTEMEKIHQLLDAASDCGAASQKQGYFSSDVARFD